MRSGNAALAVASRRGRQVRSWVDLMRWVGPGHGLRQLRATGNAAGVGQDLRSAFYDRMWRDAAGALGAGCRPLPGGFLELSRGPARTRVWQQLVSLDDVLTIRLALDKTAVHGLLTEAGLPVPEHVEIDHRDLGPARGFLAGHPGPFVVKPASGTGGGEGTTCGVRRPEELRVAVRRAAVCGPRVLVERQVPGDGYRLLLLDGELLDVVRRGAPGVVGDGRSSVHDLVAAENRRRLAARGAEGLALLRLDLDCVLTLRRAGLTLASVPAEGERVTVKTATNEGGLQDGVTFREPLDAGLVAAARAAATATGVRLAGVDVIAPPSAGPVRLDGGAIVEVNGTPGLHHHYLVAEPEHATPVAVAVLQAVLGS